MELKAALLIDGEKLGQGGRANGLAYCIVGTLFALLGIASYFVFDKLANGLQETAAAIHEKVKTDPSPEVVSNANVEQALNMIDICLGLILQTPRFVGILVAVFGVMMVLYGRVLISAYVALNTRRQSVSGQKATGPKTVI